MSKVKVKFPIVRNVSEGGHNLVRTMNKDDEVKCYFCKCPIIINSKTVHMAEDGMQIVDCPLCNSHVSVLYYFDQVDTRKKAPVNIKYHKGQKVGPGIV